VTTGDEGLGAGEFGAWRQATREALAADRDAAVPCDGCTACCTSSQFVHIEPDEQDTLAHVPRQLLVPAPGQPGVLVLCYGDDGHCPMLVEGACSIYAHRPRACRTYDCRVFAAAGLEPEQDLIAHRVRRWRFTYADDAARRDHDACVASAAALDGGVIERALRAVAT
jgi:Fe-S-cluster containining protein